MELDGRFPARRAGTSYGPLILDVFEPGGSTPKDLTGFTATFTIRRASGGVAVVDAGANSNTPGVGGTFEYQTAVADVSSPGEYIVTISMTLDSSEVAVATMGMEILPAF